MAHSAIPYVGYGLFGLLLLPSCGSGGNRPLVRRTTTAPALHRPLAYAQYAEEQDAYDRTVRT
jgi:hypothetical protein